VLVDGRVRDAAWCALALGLTYFAKPLAVPLVAAYSAVVLLWATTQLRVSERDTRARLAAVAIRLAPVAVFLLVLVVRHALTARGVDESQSGVVLGRFYTDEQEQREIRRSLARAKARRMRQPTADENAPSPARVAGKAKPALWKEPNPRHRRTELAEARARLRDAAKLRTRSEEA